MTDKNRPKIRVVRLRKKSSADKSGKGTVECPMDGECGCHGDPTPICDTECDCNCDVDPICDPECECNWVCMCDEECGCEPVDPVCD